MHFVPPAIDRTILKAAERQFSQSGRGRARRVWWWTRLATALALVMALALVTSEWQRSAKGRFARRMSIMMGRSTSWMHLHWPQVKQGSASDKRLDVNGDGSLMKGMSRQSPRTR